MPQTGGGKLTPSVRTQVTSYSYSPIVSRSVTNVASHGYYGWSRDTTNTLNYHSRKAAGLVIPDQYMHYTNYDDVGCSGTIISRGWDTRTTLSGSMRGTGYECNYLVDPDESQYISVVNRQATLKFLLELKDQKMNIANMMAERQQTLDLFTNTAKKLASAMKNLRKGNLAQAARDVGGVPSRRAQRRFNKQAVSDHSKAVANAWIELQYGWKPLISECQGAGESLAKMLDDQRTGKCRASMSRNHELSKIVNLINGRSNRYCGTEVTVKLSALYSVDYGWSRALAGIGLTNPLSPAWELVPWSFVVDWFIPVGNTIAALDATLGVSLITGSRVTVVKRTKVNFDSYTAAWESGVVTGNEKSVSITRVPFSDGFPGVPLPPLKNPVSWAHAANSLALLVQRMR